MPPKISFARLILAIAPLTVACSKSDKDRTANAPPPSAKATTTPAVTTPKGPVTASHHVQTKANWASLTSDTAAKPSAKTKIDPSTIPTDGIPKPIKGFTAFQKQTGFRVAYAKSQNPQLDQFRIAFQQERVFESVAGELNNIIKLPRVVDIQMVDCGQVNAFYDPQRGRIIMCYELIGYFVEMFKPVSKNNDELGAAIIGATIFVFFHELGHGLAHVLNLPLTGKEEDAVDQMATLILVDGGDEGVQMAMSGAQWFALQMEKEKTGAKQMPFWDEHSLSGQRFYNVACLIYGSNPSKFQPMVDNGYLPRPRAQRCPEEFARGKRAWETLLKPHLRLDAIGEPTTTEATANQKGTSKAGASCEAVVENVMQLFAVALKKEGIDIDTLDTTHKEQLRLELASQAELIGDECKEWTAEARTCVAKAKTESHLQKCDGIAE